MKMEIDELKLQIEGLIEKNNYLQDKLFYIEVITKLQIEGLKEKNQDLQDKIFYLEVINKDDYEEGLDIRPGHRCRGLK